MRTSLSLLRAVAAAALALGAVSCGWESDGGARLRELYHADEVDKDVPADPGAAEVAPEVAEVAPEVVEVAPEVPETAAEIPDATPEIPDAVDEEGTTSTDDGADPTPADVPGDVPAEVQPTGLAGTWAVRVEQLGELAPIGEVYPITTTDYFLVDVAPGATGMNLVFCNEIPVVHEEEPGFDFITTTPVALREALAAVPVVLDLADAGTTLPAQKVVWTWGLKDVGENDTLPTKKDLSDRRIWDQDGDGKLGVTVDVQSLMSGKRFMVKRAVWELAAGTLSGDGQRLSGTLTYRLEEKPLGGEPSALAQETPITPKDGSTYQMRRVSDTTCDALLAHVDEVFAP